MARWPPAGTFASLGWLLTLSIYLIARNYQLCVSIRIHIAPCIPCLSYGRVAIMTGFRFQLRAKCTCATWMKTSFLCQKHSASLARGGVNVQQRNAIVRSQNGARQSRSSIFPLQVLHKKCCIRELLLLRFLVCASPRMASLLGNLCFARQVHFVMFTGPKIQKSVRVTRNVACILNDRLFTWIIYFARYKSLRYTF